jgi:glyoxylase-like metal-dependent hydrolase (beta-lactamase superfamily II)
VKDAKDVFRAQHAVAPTISVLNCVFSKIKNRTNMSKHHPITKIAEDIYQLRLPLPFALNHVNVYLLRGTKGWTVVDTGINWEQGRDIWQLAFDELAFSFADIEQVILTHVHPDHFGLAGWLYESAQKVGHTIPIRTSPREDEQLTVIWRERMEIRFGDWLRENGMPDEMAAGVHNSMGDTHAMTLPHPPPVEHIHAGAEIQLGNRNFQIIHAPGHSDGQVIFYDEVDKLLLSGDHVLMKITPNIGLWKHSKGNPLGEFMASLAELRDLEVRVALPGHRRLIENWSGRIDELIGHHEDRLGICLEGITEGNRTPFQVAEHIFDISRFSPHEWRFAIAETLAHLEYLRQKGEIIRVDGDVAFELS